MRVIVNGQAAELPDEAGTLQAVLETLGYTQGFIAVAVNETAIPRKAYGSTPVQAGDRIEILAPMQGG